MRYISDPPPIDVIKDPGIAIPQDLLHPNYNDPRFAEKNIGRVVFLAPDAALDNEGRVEEAVYMNSAGYLLWHDFQDFGDRGERPDLVRNSAAYFEAALNDLLPKLHGNSLVFHKFGNDVPGLKLQAITAGIEGLRLFPFNEFAVIPLTEEK